MALQNLQQYGCQSGSKFKGSSAARNPKYSALGSVIFMLDIL
jgi:hypothetical protein